jgi:hypothetical protein
MSFPEGTRRSCGHFISTAPNQCPSNAISVRTGTSIARSFAAPPRSGRSMMKQAATASAPIWRSSFTAPSAVPPVAMRPGYPVIFGDAAASGAALAFSMSRPYNFRTLGRFRTLGGYADVSFLTQIRSRIGIGGGALSRRANGPWPSRPCDLFDPRLACRLRGQSDRRPEREHVRQLCGL